MKTPPEISFSLHENQGLTLNRGSFVVSWKHHFLSWNTCYHWFLLREKL